VTGDGLDGGLWEKAELVIAALMPADYRKALQHTKGDDAKRPEPPSGTASSPR